jgi:hypothetical protein
VEATDFSCKSHKKVCEVFHATLILLIPICHSFYLLLKGTALCFGFCVQLAVQTGSQAVQYGKCDAYRTCKAFTPTFHIL